MSHEGPLPKDVWGSLPHRILTLKPCPPASRTCVSPRLPLFQNPQIQVFASLTSRLRFAPSPFSTFAWYLSALQNFTLIYLAPLVGLVTYRSKESPANPSASWNTCWACVPRKAPATASFTHYELQVGFESSHCDIVQVRTVYQVPAVSCYAGCYKHRWGPWAGSAAGRQVYGDVITHQHSGRSDRKRSEAQVVAVEAHPLSGGGAGGVVMEGGGNSPAQRSLQGRWPLLGLNDREET